ncbi:hypothetical protein B0H13DRAFT_1716755 [Mycena leptocephala]|nr:hypothetical protein B0H13DRAFT_1716755 [Mycena leptocephala]
MACWKCGVMPTDCDALAAAPRSSSTEFNHLLATNDPPNDAEIPVIQDFITNDQLRLDTLNARIDILRATLDRLVLEREGVAESIRQYTAVVSPLRRVPAELMCEIFAWTLPCTRLIDGQMVEQPPWYLGHISRPWRNISLTYSSFWSSITVMHSLRHPHDTISPLAMVETQLLRSGNAALAVDFTWWTSKDEAIAAAAFLNPLLSHSNRWASLRFDCGGHCGDFLLDVLYQAKGRLPQLKKLEFTHRGDDASVPLDIFSIAPSLREVLLTNPGFEYNSPPLLIPWRQITRLRGVFRPSQLEVLAAASNLVECALGIDDWVGVLANVGTIIPLPHLRRLYTERGDLLAHLAAPRLEYLSCDTLDTALSFVIRSACRLTTLVLTHRWSVEDLIPVLENIPSLEQFLLQANTTDAMDNNHVMTAMTLSGSSQDLCPNLTSFAFGLAKHMGPGFRDVFVRMARSRIQPDGSCPLSSLRLFSRRSEDDSSDLLRWVQVLVDEGIDVSLIWGNEATTLINQARREFVLPC